MGKVEAFLICAEQMKMKRSSNNHCWKSERQQITVKRWNNEHYSSASSSNPDTALLIIDSISHQTAAARKQQEAAFQQDLADILATDDGVFISTTDSQAPGIAIQIPFIDEEDNHQRMDCDSTNNNDTLKEKNPTTDRPWLSSYNKSSHTRVGTEYQVELPPFFQN
jgi:hypothetical protein